MSTGGSSRFRIFSANLRRTSSSMQRFFLKLGELLACPTDHQLSEVNPLAVQLVAQLVQRLFDGGVSVMAC